LQTSGGRHLGLGGGAEQQEEGRNKAEAHKEKRGKLSFHPTRKSPSIRALNRVFPAPAICMIS
jgi:hypothetical protein